MSNDRLKYDRRWIERLQQLPHYRPVVEKLLQGWSLDAVTDWIMEQPDRGPLSGLKRSTIRYYLNALNIRLKENASESWKKERTLRAQRLARLAEEFTSGMRSGKDVTAQEPEPTEEEIEAMQDQHLRSLIDELTSDGLVRLMLKKQLPYIDRLEERDKQSKKPLNEWSRNMEVLISAAAVLQKNEIAQKLFEAQANTRIPQTQLLEPAQSIRKLTERERNLIRDAAEKFRTLLKRREEERIRQLIV